MKSLIPKLILMLFCVSVFAQNTPQYSWEISPYGGVSFPLGDYEKNAKSGVNFGFSLEKTVYKNLRLGLDIQHLNQPFEYPDFNGLLSDSNLDFSKENNWNATNLTLGPTINFFGKSKFNIDLFLRGGISFMNAPEQVLNYSESGHELPIYQIDKQQKTSFTGLTGLRFNYDLGNRISFFVSPYYFFTGKQFEYFRRKVDENSTFQTLSEDNGMLCYVRPSTIGFNFGISIGLGKPKDDDTPTANPMNIPTCDLTETTFCEQGTIVLKLQAEWFAQIPAYTLRFVVNIPPANLIYQQNNNNQPLNLPSGNRNHTLQIDNSMSGNTIQAKIEIINPNNGQVVCVKPISVTLPNCKIEDEFCDITASTDCVNGISELNLNTSWININGNGTVNVELFDQNNNPINVPINGNPATITSQSGNLNFNNINLSQFAGTSIKVKTTVCFELHGAPYCCEKEMEVYIPQCCDNCEGVQIIDNTDHNQKGEGWFQWFWNFPQITNSGASIEKMLITLESFGANNSTNQYIEPIPNFEISAIPTTSGQTFTATSIGSFGTGTTGRSNLWLLDFSTNPFTGGSIYMLVTPYDRKILKNYRVKFTLYRTDGTICEDYLNYNQ